MSIFLTAFLAAIVSGSFTACVMAAIIGSGRDTDEEDRSGAPEGAFSVIHLHVEKNR